MGMVAILFNNMKPFELIVNSLSTEGLMCNLVKIAQAKKIFKNYTILHSAPAGPTWRVGLSLLPSPATPLPFLSCHLSYFNSRYKTLHVGGNFMKIRLKLKQLSMFKGQFYVYSIFEVFIVEWHYIL